MPLWVSKLVPWQQIRPQQFRIRRSFKELTKAVASRLLPLETLGRNIVDCSQTDVAALENKGTDLLEAARFQRRIRCSKHSGVDSSSGALRHLLIGTVDLANPALIVVFTEQDLLPDVHESPHIELRAEYFRDLLKPQYQTAFNGTSYAE